MSSPEPVAYVFHGQDEPTLKDRLAAFCAEHTDPATADLNLTRLDGSTVQAGDIEAAAGALPFLADWRLVLVENLTASAGGRAVIDKVPEIISSLPGWARLVFVETHFTGDSSQLTARRRALRKLVDAIEQDPRGKVLEFELPEERDRPAWIQQRAARHGAAIEAQAAFLLAQRIGEDLTLADSELAKLATYTAGERPISAEDVERLTPYTPEASIFKMVDALGQRQSGEALRLLRQLLDEGDEPLRIFGMIARQYRLLIQMKEQLDRGQTPASAAKNIDVHPYVAGKLAGQVRYYSTELLERIMRYLLEVDLSIKTGEIDPALALEMLVVQLGSRS